MTSLHVIFRVGEGPILEPLDGPPAASDATREARREGVEPPTF